MSSSCSFDGCTVDTTGTCALARDVSVCSNRLSSPGQTEAQSDISSVEVHLEERLGAAVLDQPSGTRAFQSSSALSLENLNSMMACRYVKVVGILGDPESGKTACLASLYLLLSHAKLEDWDFADSKSIRAFDDISRGARDWNNGTAPEQMTVHTELSDDHGPGFLHLRLVRKSDRRRIDFALPDIPGEWTQAFVTSAVADRLDFMRSADVIWIVLDGRSLSDLEKRNGLIARVGQLSGRLHTMFEGDPPRLILVVTHHDQHPIQSAAVEKINASLARRNLQAHVIGVAPFSDNPEVAAGFGLSELINITSGNQARRPSLWEVTDPLEGGRAYLNHRRDR